MVRDARFERAVNHGAGPKSGEEESMTDYDLTKDRGHDCKSDLSQLRSNDANITWECTVCGRLAFLEDVVEMLRVRAVAQDAASRVHRLRSAPEPVPGGVIGHAPAEHAYFAPLIPPVRLREQGGL